jgi:hypothetical protein
VALTESVALTVKLLVPDTVGIPDIIPPDERVSPAGSDPADIVQVYGDTPPLADNDPPEYEVPTVPPGIVAVVTESDGFGEDSTVQLHASLSTFPVTSVAVRVKLAT